MEVVQGGSPAKTLDFHDNDPLCSRLLLPFCTEIGIELRTKVGDGVWVCDNSPPILHQCISDSFVDKILLRHPAPPHSCTLYPSGEYINIRGRPKPSGT